MRLGIDGDVHVFVSTDRLPYSVRILLESAIRNCDEFQVKSHDVEKIIDWENTSPKQVEIPFKPARVLLQVSNVKMLMLSVIAFVKFFECLLFLWCLVDSGFLNGDIRILLVYLLSLILLACETQ